MSFVVYLGEMLEVKVSIDLGGRYVGVPKQFLNPTQVVTRFQQMRGKGVPKQMRGDICVDALPARPMGNARLYRAFAQPRAAITDKHGVLVGCSELAS